MTSYGHLLLLSRCLPGDLELDDLFKDHGVSWLAIDEKFALEWATYRCFPAQPPLSTLRYNKRKCAHLLRDLAATIDPPLPTVHSLPFSSWTWLSTSSMSLPRAAAVYILVKMNPTPAQDPQQTGRLLANLLADSSPDASLRTIVAHCMENSANCR